MKINAGCGSKILKGWVNVDLNGAADVRCDLRALSRHFAPGAAETIMAIHVIEHLFQRDVPLVLRAFHRVLRKNGLLILELPDVAKCCQNLLDGKPDQQSLWGLYGEHDPSADPLPQCHKWGWTFATLSPLVEAAGFRDVVERQTEYHRAGREHRDFRLEARKA